MHTKYRGKYAEFLKEDCLGNWYRITEEWKKADGFEAVWLAGAANYLFYTNGIHWAMDLSFKNPTIFQKLSPVLTETLKPLKYLIVTHDHNDHFNRETVNELSKLNITWIIPDFMRDVVKSETKIRPEAICWIKAGDCIKLSSLEIEAFEGMHWENNGQTGTDCMGYRILTDAGNVLFTGDVRTYDRCHMPQFKDIYLSFCHVWLGRLNALNKEPYDMIDAFCTFHLSFSPKKILLSHLYEIDRTDDSLWTHEHAGMIMDALAARSATTVTDMARIWRRVDL